MRSLGFVVPEDLDRPTGGNRYDQALAQALAELRVRVDLRRVQGRWPVAAPEDRARLAKELAGPGPVLVDGLLACAAPEETAAAVAGGAQVHVLVHMPLALVPALSPAEAAARDAVEGEALRAATSVLATSGWTAAVLRARHRLGTVRVARPGVYPAPVAAGSRPPLLLQAAAVAPWKNQHTVVEALALLRDETWSALLVGPLDVDRSYVSRVRETVARHGLTGRVRLTGPLGGQVYDEVWHAGDLLLLPSIVECWGMAVTEGLARGIPAVVGRATGAEEALGRTSDGRVPGAVVDPRSPQDLAAAIADLLGPGRAVARGAALARRRTLPGWPQTAAVVREALA